MYLLCHRPCCCCVASTRADPGKNVTLAGTYGSPAVCFHVASAISGCCDTVFARRTIRGVCVMSTRRRFQACCAAPLRGLCLPHVTIETARSEELGTRGNKGPGRQPLASITCHNPGCACLAGSDYFTTTSTYTFEVHLFMDAHANLAVRCHAFEGALYARS